MTFPLVAALVFTLATLLPAALVGIAMAIWAPRVRYWRWVWWGHAALFVLHLCVTFPLALGYVGSRLIGTRPHERTYAGPRLDGNGALLVQDWDSLAREKAAGRPEVDAATAAAAAARERLVPSSDGVTLRTFRLEARQEPPVAVAVLVHGLFRSAMELEPVAAMLRDQGCECWLVELRNHGGSSRAPFTGGLRESDDVVAAVDHVRAQPGRATAPIVLFGVSLGTVAISLALPRIDGVAGVVLDSPIDDLAAAARRMLSFHRENDRRSFFAMSEPWQSAVIAALGAWSAFDVADVSPSDVLATLPHDLPMLLIASGHDDRAPASTVERMFARLPMPDALKEFWFAADAHHGDACRSAATDYAAHLQRLLQHLRHP